MKQFPSFTARIISGAGRGHTIGSPTINLHLQDIPAELTEGIFACFAFLDDHRFPGALFYGPRPVFHDTPTCEVHLIDTVPEGVPETITVQVIGFLRSVQNFPTVSNLQEQIHRDVSQARAMLASHASQNPKNTDL